MTYFINMDRLKEMSIISALFNADYNNQTRFEYLDDTIASGNYEGIKTLEYEVNWYKNYLYPTLEISISIGDVVKWICGEKDERYYEYMAAIEELKVRKSFWCGNLIYHC